MKNLIPVVASAFLIAGCQSTPSQNTPASGIEFAHDKFSVLMVSVDDTFDFPRGKFFRSSYAIQEKLTVKLPGVVGIYADFFDHCLNTGNKPQIIDGVALVCRSDQVNLYAVIAVEAGRTAWLQVVEPSDMSLQISAQELADYSMNNFANYVEADVSSTKRLLGTSSLYKNVPDWP
ncbi:MULTISPECIES: hypothetical protein [Aeromonas]|jgi:hypothetical protein|uniref:hypothetical protein n=1 Tax=Aeromonas TaxID=642 RepID=UPI001116928C|nr:MULTISPECIES: hypothetical protein [Aeromonas]KAJ8739600.1 hypothetical protein H9Y13_16260 [Aeromonas veronii]MDA3317468.1 hypothetical protein [Aeromonas sp. PI_26]